MPELITKSRLTRFLKDPQTAFDTYTQEDWSALIRQSRRCNLISRVASTVRKHDKLGSVPASQQYLLNGSLLLSESHLRAVNWEIIQIYKALKEAEIPFALLKGAAYVINSSRAADGRIFGDVDILVKKTDLNNAEMALLKHGWFGTKLDAYDQQYYRQWMHELPPLQNLKRHTDLDVHHTILPPTAVLKPDVEKIWEQVVSVPEFPGMFVLSPLDMILHSATHLFHEGDFEHGLRDLTDIDLLLRENIETDSFWPRLLARAEELNLTRPLYYALRYSNMLLDTPVSDNWVVSKKQGEPGIVKRLLMDAMLLKAMAPDYIGNHVRFSSLAKFALYIRSHYLRMPLKLLIPHLIRKVSQD